MSRCEQVNEFVRIEVVEPLPVDSLFAQWYRHVHRWTREMGQEPLVRGPLDRESTGLLDCPDVHGTRFLPGGIPTMAKKTTRDRVIECLRAFLRRRTKASAEDLDAWIARLASRLASAAPRPTRRRARLRFSLAESEAIEIPKDACFKHGQTSIRTKKRGSTPAGKTKRQPQRSASDLHRHLREHYRPRLAPIAFPRSAVAAVEPSTPVVYQRIAYLVEYITAQIQAGDLPCADLVDAHRANALFDERGNVFLGQATRQLMLNDKDGLAFLRLLLTAEQALDNVLRGTHVTKRGLFYLQRAKLHDRRMTQTDSDRALAALSSILQLRRKTLGFVEALRGTVYGRLVVRAGNDVIHVSQLGPRGLSVPRFVDDLELLESDAQFVLIVEKEAIAYRLAEARWFDMHPCVVVCGSGSPSFSMREFVRRLVNTLRIPAFLCADADPGGVRIALTYAHGSICSALETPWLACDDIWWAGLCPSDIDRFQLDCAWELPMDRGEMKAARRLACSASEVQVNTRVRRELEVMIDRRSKMEMEAIDFSAFANDYLPRKLWDSDLIKL